MAILDPGVGLVQPGTALDGAVYRPNIQTKDTFLICAHFNEVMPCKYLQRQSKVMLLFPAMHMRVSGDGSKDNERHKLLEGQIHGD